MKATRNTGKPWTRTDFLELIRLIDHRTPLRIIALKLGRTEAAIRKVLE